jgi:hypothetical protein
MMQHHATPCLHSYQYSIEKAGVGFEVDLVPYTFVLILVNNIN